MRVAGGTTRRMVPAASWSPEDYYRASRRARDAWQATDQQLSILSDSPSLALLGALGAADTGTASSGGVGSTERVPPCPVPSPGDALDNPTKEATP